MSTFPDRNELVPGMEVWETMAADFERMIPRQFAGAFNLMAHPAGAMAASSAIGLGMASHAMGLWMGAIAGMSESAQRAFAGEIERGATEPAYKPKASPSARARAAVDTLVADARSAARGAREALDEPAPATQDTPSMAVVKEVPADLMPEDFVKPKGMEKPAAPDDLKTISGIGPKLEQVLNGLGIWTYGQIAAWSPQEVAWVDDFLSFKGRIERDGWIGQAKTLNGTNE